MDSITIKTLIAFIVINVTSTDFCGLLEDGYKIGPADVDCVVSAAKRQRVPVNILLAIASVEGGKNGQFVTNTNGSRDLGHFQINTIHWTQKGLFAAYPLITKFDVAWRGCYNAEIAAWILRIYIEENSTQDYWTRVANYHSKIPKFNAAYRKKLIPYAIRWGYWLEQHYNVSVTQK